MSTGRMADDWVECVRAASDVVEVIGQTVTLKRVGRNWVGLCPFHEERTPSFSVNAERQFYHCFSCKVGGDVFRFIQETERVGFLESVELLSHRAGIAVPERRNAERGTRAPLLEALEAATTAYEQWLADPDSGAAARAYLERRGITRETQRTFRLGLAPPGWESLVPRLKGRFRDDVLLEARLAGQRESTHTLYDWFRNRLMVPLIAPGGSVLGFGARAMGDDKPKYLNSPESTVYQKSRYLFGLEQARKHIKPDGEVIVVEGYFDAIALSQAGLQNVVATSGTALTADHARQLARLARGVALTYDGDSAGQDAMLRSLGVLLAEGLDVVVVDLPAGQDPDTFIRGEGEAGWCRVRDSSYDAIEFVHRHVLRRASGGDPRERALQTVVRLATGVPDAIRRRLLVERASQVFGLSENVIDRAVHLARTGQGSERPIAAALGEQRRTQDQLERRLLQALVWAPEVLDEARGAFTPRDFRDPVAADLAADWWENGVDVPLGEGPAVALARELLAGSQEGSDPVAEAKGVLRRLKARSLEEERRELQSQLASAREEESNRILQRIQDIAITLRHLQQP